MGAKGFDLVVGNPPYQISKDTGQQGDKVYQDFWKVGSLVGKKNCQIFLMGWQTQRGVEFKSMREDKRIVMIDNYYENNSGVRVFEGVKTGGVSIVLRDYSYEGPVVLKEYGVVVDKPPYDNAPENKKPNPLYGENSPYKKFSLIGGGGDGFSGISTKFIQDNPSFKKIGEFVDGDDLEFRDGNGRILLVSNSGVGKSGRAVVYVTEERFIQKNRDKIGKYKVVVSNSFQPTILGPGVMPGRIRPVFVRAVDTFVEAYNMKQYILSSFFKGLGKEAPDLTGVLNHRTGKRGYSGGWSDEDLLNVFGKFI